MLIEIILFNVFQCMIKMYTGINIFQSPAPITAYWILTSSSDCGERYDKPDKVDEDDNTELVLDMWPNVGADSL